jgi:hypothetical protein
MLNTLRQWLKTPTMLFYRQFHGFSGGHLKYWHYYNHVRASGLYKTQIYFTPDSIWNNTNPWLSEHQHSIKTWHPQDADCLFLAGLDWQAVPESERHHFSRPIINLIQHIRHADPNDPRYAFLGHRAVRICVSAEVAEALQASGRVNGPIFVNPNGLDIKPLNENKSERKIPILIAGLKQPELAQALHAHLHQQGYTAQLLSTPHPRQEFLNYVQNAAITVFLPHQTEGFYLPALEGMALGTLVICPDCIGNRSFCVPEQNCLQPSLNLVDLANAVLRAIYFTPEQRNSLMTHAKQMAYHYSIVREQTQFINIVREIKHLW